MDECNFLGRVVSTRTSDGVAFDVRRCNHFKKSCTVEDQGIIALDGKMLVCNECPMHPANRPRAVPNNAMPPAVKSSPVYLELVGDKLHEIITECGIKRPTCGECGRWRRLMNEWGCEECDKEHREEIINRLNAEAKAGTWMEAIKVAGRGYLSTGMLLDEAIKRARSYSLEISSPVSGS